MPLHKPQTEKAVVIATGPSLDDRAIEWALRKQKDHGWTLVGMNNVYQDVPWIDVLMCCNIEWWDYYWHDDSLLRRAPFDKWTWDLETSQRYGINYIEGKWAPSLSKDPRCIHYGHASGYQALGMAYRYGAREIYLLGYDMAYPPNQPRHYFGEYPKPLYHNPRTGPKGEFLGLIEQFKTINETDLGAKIYNLCPTSALNHFEKGSIDDF